MGNAAALLTLIERAAPRVSSQTETASLETLLCSRDYFGLVKATPVQRALCRATDGRPLDTLADDPDVQWAFGGAEAIGALPVGERPAEVAPIAAIRSAKSLFCAAAAVRMSQICDVSRLGPGEVPRIPIVSLTVDLAQVVFRHLLGGVMTSTRLRPLMLGKPTADTVTLRHPTGRPIEIKVTAGARAGGSLVARWLAGCIFDEAARMLGEDDAVVNLEEQRTAIRGRLLPGAQILYPSSPYAAFGPIYEMVQRSWGAPSRALVVLRGTGPQMNPEHWTPERCADLKETDPDAYQTDVMAEFRTPDANMFTEAMIKRATRAEPVEAAPYPGHHYVAAIDPATRGNAWTLTIGTCAGSINGVRAYSIALARQWIGSKVKPLQPLVILSEISDILAKYQVRVCYTDQYAADALRDLGHLCGVSLVERPWTQGNKLDAFERLLVLLVSGNLELPPVADVARDLLQVRKRVTKQTVTIELPRTPDGRHCDFAPCLAELLESPISLPTEVKAPEAPAVAWVKKLEARRERAERPFWSVDASEVGL